MQKFSLTLTGNVQGADFGVLIEDIARLHDLKGYAFNDAGTVKIICGGEKDNINHFFEELRIKGKRKGIIFDITQKKDYPPGIVLPGIFLWVY